MTSIDHIVDESVIEKLEVPLIEHLESLREKYNVRTGKNYSLWQYINRVYEPFYRGYLHAHQDHMHKDRHN